MKQFTKYSLFSMALLAGAAAFTACSSDDNLAEETALVNPSYNGETVKTEFAINIPHANTNKRMTSDNTQNTASSGSNNFLGMEGINLIPLNIANPGTAGTVTGSEGISSIIRLSNITASFGGTGDGESGPSDNEGQKIYSDVEIPTGTNTFLFYGQALYKTSPAYSTEAEKYFAQGALETSLDDGSISTVNDITFNLKQILTNRGDLTTPQNVLLDQLDDVMDVSGWSTLTDDTPSNPDKATLIALHDAMQTLKAGSANAIKAAMEELYFAVDKIANDTEGTAGNDNPVTIAKAIQAAIASDDDNSGSVTEAPLFYTKEDAGAGAGTTTIEWKTGVDDNVKKFPENFNLPDGAMQVKWDNSAFAYVKDNNTGGSSDGIIVGSGDNKVPLNSLTYPASLAYYISTAAKTNDDPTASFPAAGSWMNTGNWSGWEAAVQPTTRLVALEKNIQYGVAQLATTVKFAKNNVDDSEGNSVVVGIDRFTLDGILVGGQPTKLGYNLLPATGTGAAEFTQTVYDNAVADNTYVTTAATNANYTLLLDNKGAGGNGAEADKVNFALEMTNNGDAFYGVDGGLIAKGMKFYLVGTLNKASGGNASSPAPSGVDHIFMQDYKTTATVTISSLENAYVTIPDLRATNLQLGLSVDLEWQKGYTFNVSIN